MGSQFESRDDVARPIEEERAQVERLGEVGQEGERGSDRQGHHVPRRHQFLSDCGDSTFGGQPAVLHGALWRAAWIPHTRQFLRSSKRCGKRSGDGPVTHMVRDSGRSSPR